MLLRTGYIEGVVVFYYNFMKLTWLYKPSMMIFTLLMALRRKKLLKNLGYKPTPPFGKNSRTE